MVNGPFLLVLKQTDFLSFSQATSNDLEFDARFETNGNVCVTVELGLRVVATGSREDNYGRAGITRAAINVSVLTDHK